MILFFGDSLRHSKFYRNQSINAIRYYWQRKLGDCTGEDSDRKIKKNQLVDPK
jgi:hypothetical protein